MNSMNSWVVFLELICDDTFHFSRRNRIFFHPGKGAARKRNLPQGGLVIQILRQLSNEKNLAVLGYIGELYYPFIWGL